MHVAPWIFSTTFNHLYEDDEDFKDDFSDVTMVSEDNAACDVSPVSVAMFLTKLVDMRSCLMVARVLSTKTTIGGLIES